MRDEYDFSKGKRGGFHHPNAKVHLPEKDDLAYGDENNLGANEFISQLSNGTLSAVFAIQQQNQFKGI